MRGRRTWVVRVATCWMYISFSSLASRAIWLDLIRSDISLKFASSFSLEVKDSLRFFWAFNGLIKSCGSVERT